MEELKNLKRMFTYHGYHKRLNLCFFLIVLGCVFEIIMIPFFTTKIIDIAIPNSSIIAVIGYSMFFLITTCLSGYITLKFCIVRLEIKRMITSDLREDIFKKLQYVENSFYDKNSTGLLLQFLTKDTEEAASLCTDILIKIVLMGLARICIEMILIFFIDVKVAIGILVIYLIGYMIPVIQNRKNILNFKKIRKISIQIYNLINEQVQGFTTIRVLGMQQMKLQELEQAIQEFMKEQILIKKKINKYNAIFYFITSFSTIWMIFMGSIDLNSGILTYGSFMIMQSYLSEITGNFNWCIEGLGEYAHSYLAFFKILQLIGKEKLEDTTQKRKIGEIEKIEFKDVCFSYHSSQMVLKNVSLEINVNQTIGMVGKTGSGKTTLVNLIGRLYKPDKGTILINDIAIEEYDLTSLRSRIGYIIQDAYIIDGSILENMRYVKKEASLEEIKAMFVKLQLHDKIESLEKGYETSVSLLSKGERQLINFARILLMNPDVIILDEFSSSLSFHKENILSSIIQKIAKDKICIIIAHRLSTVKSCDTILVLEDGEIIENGTHEQLIEQNGKYANMIKNKNNYLQELEAGIMQ